ncbi:HAD-IIA family hydrolase [Halorussus vallis]|uniref:HAD-IIA family hydrolase n=3 Tax=Halorussus TaxID=1070314 RepID=UPI0020A1ABC1|nr:HAD-IIA family hydrolase [Halorussus vallis]USZ77025.1 HAD-IIA family hydrolase [Halorussus vallis]
MTFGNVILDVDGTLVRGDEPIPGAADAVERLREAGRDVLLFSNNPTRAPVDYADWLAELGFAVAPEEILTCGAVTADYLAAEFPVSPTFVVGERGLRALLRDRGIDLTSDPDAAEVVVASIDREFDYDRLRDALWALDGATFVATDPDRTIPAVDRPVPGSGAIVAAVGGAADRDPDATLGKPSERAGRAALARLDAAPGDCLVVGDRLDTDLAMGERAGMRTALVLTGVATKVDAEQASAPPDFVLDSVADVDELL